MTNRPGDYDVVEFGTSPQVPLLSFVVFTYERARLLREFLDSLITVPGVQECELVLVNNGSSLDSYESLPDWLADLGMPCRLLTFSRNILGPQRMRQALAHCNADYVSHPGDDDILLPSLVSQFKDLHADTPNAVLYMAPAIALNQDGTEHMMSVPDFPSAEIAVGNLLSSNSYPLPSAIIHRSVFESPSASHTRTAADWNLWLRGWMLGPVVTGEKPTVKYRLHAGQEQRRYYAGSGYLDAIRMITSELAGPVFQDWLARRTDNGLEALADTILNGKGIAEDAGSESGLLQLMLADLVSDRVSLDIRVAMYAQGAVSAGIPMSLEALRTAAQAESLTEVPQQAWTRAGVGLDTRNLNQTVPEFVARLNFPEYARQSCRVVLRKANHVRSGSADLLVDVEARRHQIFSCRIGPSAVDSSESIERVLHGVAIVLRARNRIVESPLRQAMEAWMWRIKSRLRARYVSGGRRA